MDLKQEPESFELLAKATKWNESSQNIVKAFFRDKLSYSEIAEQCGVSAQHARVIVTRYQKLLVVHEFEVETPKLGTPRILTDNKAEIKRLNNAGYTPEQIMDFIRKLGGDVEINKLVEFLEEIK